MLTKLSLPLLRRDDRNVGTVRSLQELFFYKRAYAISFILTTLRFLPICAFKNDTMARLRAFADYFLGDNRTFLFCRSNVNSVIFMHRNNDYETPL